MARTYARDEKGRFASTGGGIRGSLGAMRPGTKLTVLATRQAANAAGVERRQLRERLVTKGKKGPSVAEMVKIQGRIGKLNQRISTANQFAHHAQAKVVAAQTKRMKERENASKRSGKPRSLPTGIGKPRSLATTGINRVREAAVIKLQDRSYRRSGDVRHAQRLYDRMERDSRTRASKRAGSALASRADRALREASRVRSSGNVVKTSRGAGSATSVRASRPNIRIRSTGTTRTVRTRR